MSLNISSIRNRLLDQFHLVEQIDDYLLRFRRDENETPFAIYYLDLADALPQSPKDLASYLDRVIGPHYFEGSKALQWNHYLYFVTSRDRFESNEIRQAKAWIEQDRTYARKFVLPEEQLDAALKPLTLDTNQTPLQPRVLSLWTQRLARHNLDAAILSDDDSPTRLLLIETPPPDITFQQNLSTPVTPIETPQKLRRLQLKNFRAFPTQRDFAFADVNLLFGINGSGKTSLLEAIELFYCGRNKRTPNAGLVYELEAILEDNRSDIADNNRPLQHFRDRNLSWYGQPEVKTNNLYLSFSQFNFLDTDAAVDFARDANSTARLETSLSSLLIGPDASKVWRNMERVRDAVGGKLHGLRQMKAEINDELQNLERRLLEASEVRQESDAISARLKEMLRRNQWRNFDDESPLSTDQIIGVVSEMESLAEQASTLRGLPAPVSLDRLKAFLKETLDACFKAEPIHRRVVHLQRSRVQRNEPLLRCRHVRDRLNIVKRAIDADVFTRIRMRREQSEFVSEYAVLLEGLNWEILSTLPESQLDLQLEGFNRVTAAERVSTGRRLDEIRHEYDSFSRLRDQSVTLSQQLRQIASRLLENSREPDRCPLCHTQFGPEQLASHMALGVDQHLESLGQSLIIKLRDLEMAFSQVVAHERVAVELRAFAERARLSPETTLRDAISSFGRVRIALLEARDRLDILTRELASLEAQGFSLSGLEESFRQLADLGHNLAEPYTEAVNQLLVSVADDITRLNREQELEISEEARLKESLDEILRAAGYGDGGVEAALSEMKEQCVTTESLVGRLEEQSRFLSWPPSNPLSELVVGCRSIRRVAVELQNAISRESQAKGTVAELSARKIILVERKEPLEPQIIRFNEAYETLSSIRSEHSLASAMESVLSEYRVTINAIFSRIHSPPEFVGFDSSVGHLQRNDGGVASLNEVSTGQRAAFALSIFLAQNAHLRNAPPVILIDDPIAHIDDLNSLSFLDYLREIILGRHRQVFFATANEKLAALFERKFDFLGPERFRRFDLQRDNTSV